MKACESNLVELKEKVLIEIYDNWENKTRLELSKIDSLVALSEYIPSLKYYVENKLCSWSYDKVDNEDIRDLEYHINYYFNVFID